MQHHAGSSREKPWHFLDGDPIERRMRELDDATRDAVLVAQTEMSRSLKAAGLNFEGLAYPVSLRPIALSEERARALASMAERMLKLLDIAAALYLEDATVRRLFAHYDRVARYITAVPGLAPLASICRLDTMLAPDGEYRIVETNADCPGGIIQGALATRIWGETASPLTDGLMVDESAQPFVLDPDCCCRALLECHRTITGRSPRRAAVINFHGRFTNEVPQIVAALNRLGVEAVARDLRELRRIGGGGISDDSGGRFDLIYNKLDPRDLLDEPLAADYLAAVAAGEVTSINSLVSQWILADKAVLALLSDERFAANFTAADRNLIETHVPWTRFVRAGRTSDRDRRPIDLLPYIVEHRRELVLKPSNATRGEGAVVGPETRQDEWEHYVVEVANSAPHVVQDYLPGSVITAPNPMSGAIDTMTAGLDVYVFNGRFTGFHARASLDPVINIGKRGMLLPVAVTKGAAS
jgi:diaminobutyrate-2-oxoglutarate transaminase